MAYPTCCPVCKRPPFRTYIMWANGHGRCVRLFCPCGVWTDHREISGKYEWRFVSKDTAPDGEHIRYRPGAYLTSECNTGERS